MKKRFLPLILSAVLGFCFLTGCSSPSVLAFNNAYNGDVAPSGALTEVLTYEVNYDQKNLSSNVKNNENVSFEFSKGINQVTLTVLNNKPSLPEGIETNIFNLANSSVKYYHLVSTLSLPVKYVIDGEVYEHIDTVRQEVYFFDNTLSYAPIYSKTDIDYTVFFLGAEKSYLQKAISSSEIVYLEKSYSVKTNVYNENNQSPESMTTDYEYTFQTLVDNNQLLFVLRNLPLEDEASTLIPTVSYSYGEAKDLKVLCETSTTKKININYNGNNLTENLSCRELQYNINSINSAGSIQTLFVQKNKGENLPYKALPIVYEESLVAYGTFSPMGTLVYTLINVTNN